MADEKRFVLVVESKDGENSSGSVKANASTGSPDTQDNDDSKIYFQNLAIQTAGQVATEALSFAEYFWDEELRLTDDYIGQRQKRIAKQAINKVANTVSSIVSSTATGATLGGAYGALAGFVISTTTAIYKTIHEDYKGDREQNIMLKQMEAQLDFTRSRAGWSTQAASIGEDL